MKKFLALFVAGSLTPAVTLAGTLEDHVVREGGRFDFTVKAPEAPAVAGGFANEGGAARKPGALATLLGDRKQPLKGPPPPKGGDLGKSRSQLGRIGNAAREVTAVGVGLVAGAVAAAAGLAYAGSIVLPVLMATALTAEGHDPRSFGKILADHLSSPVNWAAAKFRRAREGTIKGLTPCGC